VISLLQAEPTRTPTNISGHVAEGSQALMIVKLIQLMKKRNSRNSPATQHANASIVSDYALDANQLPAHL
jgi:hypothetical protein